MKKINLLLSFVVLTTGFSSFTQKPSETRPYTIHEKSNFLQITVEKQQNGIANSITFDTKNVSGGMPTMRGVILPPAVIENIEPVQGSYTQKQMVIESGRGQIFVLKEIRFPYRARFHMNSDQDWFDLEIKEAGTYSVIVAQKR